jgi:hypothetical protein
LFLHVSVREKKRRRRRRRRIHRVRKLLRRG